MVIMAAHIMAYSILVFSHERVFSVVVLRVLVSLLMFCERTLSGDRS
jgi:hypothetical protein